MHPFSSQTDQTVQAVGELGLLARVRQWLGEVAPPSPYGMGDDAAVLLQPTANIFKADSLAYGRHWDDGVTPEKAGAKLLKRNLSDMAAMGAEPREAVLAGFLPARTRLDWLEGFFAGLRATAEQAQVKIVGGDLTQTDDFLGFSLSLLGTAAHPILRAGARPGDHLYVTGELGGSILGHHLDFSPRLPEGRWLAQRGEVRAAIDITDGLAKDLPALLLAEGKGPRLQAWVDIECLPVRTAARELAGRDGRSVTDHVFTDGEDYELLFVVDGQRRAEDFESAWEEAGLCRLTRIGEIRESQGRNLLIDSRTGEGLPFTHGYEFFRGP